jgi:hypothetical protein
MEWIIENWYFIIVAIAVLSVSAYALYCFIKMPVDQKYKKILNWMLYAVTVAEAQLGSGTGEIKLVAVYDAFLSKFRFLSSFMSYETFKQLVDVSLNQMRNLLDKNIKIAEIVEHAEIEG